MLATAKTTYVSYGVKLTYNHKSDLRPSLEAVFSLSVLGYRRNMTVQLDDNNILIKTL